VAFCRTLTTEAKVTAIPVTAFYEGADAPSHYARFAFCKADHLLDEALERMRVWLAARGQLTAAVG
jgi:aspartate/methionine/tyrosine aminotransferase